MQQVHLAAKETHGSLQHSKKRKTNKTTLFGFLVDFPLSGLLNAAMHLCWVPDTPVTTGTTNNADVEWQTASSSAAADQSSDLPRPLQQLLGNFVDIQVELALGLQLCCPSRG